MMTDEELSCLRQLEGRIAACEVMHRYLLDFLAILAGPENRANQVEAMERAVMSNLQHIARQVSPDDDAVWEAMSDALRKMFGEVRLHAEYAAILASPPTDQ